MTSIITSRQLGLYSSFTDQAIQARQRELGRLNEQMSTGLSINRASDDPAAYGQARRMEVLSDRYAGYQRSIDTAKAWVNHSEQSLNDLAEFFTEAYERGIRIASDTASDSDRETFANRLEFILNNVPDQLNEKHGDEYLFSGSRSTVQPFTTDGSGTPDAAGVSYHGNDGPRVRTIGLDTSLNIGIDGNTVWNVDDNGDGTSDFTITEALSALIEGVRQGDAAAMGEGIRQVTAARDHLLNLASEAGNTMNRLELAETQLGDAAVLVEARRSELEDADYAGLIAKLQKGQTGLQAALKVSASTLQTTILDYLR